MKLPSAPVVDWASRAGALAVAAHRLTVAPATGRRLPGPVLRRGQQLQPGWRGSRAMPPRSAAWLFRRYVRVQVFLSLLRIVPPNSTTSFVGGLCVFGRGPVLVAKP